MDKMLCNFAPRRCLYMHAGLPYENCGRQAVKSHIGAEGGGVWKNITCKKIYKDGEI